MSAEEPPDDDDDLPDEPEDDSDDEEEAVDDQETPADDEEASDEVDEEEPADDEETPADEEEEASDDDEEETDDEETDETSDDEETPADEEEEASDDDEEETDEEETDEEETDDEDDTSDEEDEELADEADLPSLDDDVFGSRADYPEAAEDDFDDDAGDWTEDDYHGVAQTLFGTHEHFGDTAVKRWLDEGFLRSEMADSFFASAIEQVPEARGVQFFEREGQIVPRGVLTTVALALLETAFPDLDLSRLHVTIPARPRRPVSDDTDTDSVAPPARRELPDALKNLPTAESVDLRKYASPVGDQGSTSRCAAFAWTHAVEMLGNVQGRPFPRLACSFTMLRFQQRQGDAKDFAWAYKGGDGTSGTWEPGHHVFTTGTCREELWPNDKKHPHVTADEMESDAQNHRLEVDVYDVTVDEMKKLLTAGLPVQISMATGEKFGDIGRDGVLNAAEKPSGQHGYHAMLCVGYVGNYFIIKNSWGDDWGDAGYCYIPKMVLQQSEPEPVAIVPRRPNQGPPGAPPPPQAPGPPPGPAAAAQQYAPPVAAPPAPATALATCPHCAVSVAAGKFCTSCGRPVVQRRFCTQCGAPREGAGRFCAACGAPHGS